MVGIVIVSHSAKLAEGVLELARAVGGPGGPDIPLAAAGGLDLPDRPLGTDAMLVLASIEQVYSDAGVLVLMDLGSAVLSAEMALDMLDPERRSHVRLCEAPLIEGAVAAAVQARLGSPLDVVMAEALNGLTPKAAQLGHAPTSPAGEQPAVLEPAAARLTLRLTVHNRSGLHARPAARFVQTAGRFQSAIHIANVTAARGPVTAKSINAVATLGVRAGDEIDVTASGPDAEAALEAIRLLAAENFGDTGEALNEAPPAGFEPTAQPVSDGTLQGLPASPGLAVGPVRTFRVAASDISTASAANSQANPQTEWERVKAAIEQARAQIQAAGTIVRQQVGQQAASIFDAHVLYLDDEALLDPTRHAIFADRPEDRLGGAAAWWRAVETMAAQYRALDDEYQRSRAADVLEVGRQVLAFLANPAVVQPPVPLSFAERGILVAVDLTAADVAHLDPARVLGICLAFGGPTSHSVILARALNIPAVVGLGESILSWPDGTPIALDGDTGQVTPNPDAPTVLYYTRRIEAQRDAQAEASAASAAPAVTRDGHRIEVVANIGSIADAAAAVQAGAEGVGVLRTEFLFLDRQTAPGEDEQVAAYRAIAQALGGRTFIIRTLDVGGDKPLPYVNQEPELNPFLGRRAIRLCLARPDLFKTQLRAIVRTAAEFPAKIMFPMIATLEEFRAAQTLLAEAQDELAARDGIERIERRRIETGIMVEIPAAALRASSFAPEVDFFSIGTNDLTQYTLAAERGNPQVAALTDAFQPTVLQLIQQVVVAAHAHGKWAGVCGELAGDPLAAPLLVGLGVDELSMNVSAVPRVKQVIRTLDYSVVEAAVPALLALESPGAIRAALSGSPDTP